MYQNVFQTFIPALLAGLLVSSCAGTGFTGFSYDPEGVEDTSDKKTFSQYYRSIGFSGDGVWFSNEYEGARMNDAYRIGKYHYRIVIDPENEPINNSPWYGFKVWADQPAEIKVELVYPVSEQRYIPKLSHDGEAWQVIEDKHFEKDSTRNAGLLHLNVSPDTLWVSAQETRTTESLSDWLGNMKSKPFINTQTIGYSHNGRPLKLLKATSISGEPQKGVILIFSRQHPPELPGYIASLEFIEVLTSEQPLAREFREYFDIWAFPMINPDGADEGHWRHNAAGVDLNRDWEHFNQPETRAVREALLDLKKRPNKKVYYAIDFHSTSSNIFYPIERQYDTFPKHFTYDWAEHIIKEFPELELDVQPFDTSSPIAKNWTFKTFGADAVTFEIDDEIDRDLLNRYATGSAEIFMEKMIEAYLEHTHQMAEKSDP
ncbi:MAG: M14 family metallopeptidase [Balneolaceae bacterium]